MIIKKIFPIALVLLMSGCAAFHTGYLTDSVSLSQANFSWVDPEKESALGSIDSGKDIILTSMGDTIIGKIVSIGGTNDASSMKIHFKPEGEEQVRQIPITVVENYKRDGTWNKPMNKIRGTATATYVLGIGGFNHQAIVSEAASEMRKNAPLGDNEAYANIAVNWKNSYIIFGLVKQSKCTVTAEIVRFNK